MSRTIRSKRRDHRGEMNFRAHRGKKTKGSKKTRKQIPDDWDLRNISRKFRERKDLENKYPEKAIDKELETWRSDK